MSQSMADNHDVLSAATEQIPEHKASVDIANRAKTPDALYAVGDRVIVSYAHGGKMKPWRVKVVSRRFDATKRIYLYTVDEVAGNWSDKEFVEAKIRTK